MPSPLLLLPLEPSRRWGGGGPLSTDRLVLALPSVLAALLSLEGSLFTRALRSSAPMEEEGGRRLYWFQNCSDEQGEGGEELLESVEEGEE